MRARLTWADAKRHEELSERSERRGLRLLEWVFLLVGLIARSLGAEVHLMGRSARSIDYARSLGFDGAWTESDLPELPWDAVIDASGQVPAVVAASAEALRPKAARYVYLSTVNAYKGWPDEPLTDDSPVYEPALEEIAVKPGAAEGSTER